TTARLERRPSRVVRVGAPPDDQPQSDLRVAAQRVGRRCTPSNREVGAGGQGAWSRSRGGAPLSPDWAALGGPAPECAQRGGGVPKRVPALAEIPRQHPRRPPPIRRGGQLADGRPAARCRAGGGRRRRREGGLAVRKGRRPGGAPVAG